MESLSSSSEVTGYSLLSASIGSIFDALHAGYIPEITQTTTPTAIAAGTYRMLAGWKKYAVVPIIASTTVYPMRTLHTPPIPAPSSPRMNASYKNIRRTSPFSVPIERRMPISWIRSETDIIITLNILTAATRSDIPPIAIINVVTVLSVEVSVASCEEASLILTDGVFELVLIFASSALSISLILSTSLTITLTWVHSSLPPYWSVYHWLFTTIPLSVEIPSATVPRGWITPAI